MAKKRHVSASSVVFGPEPDFSKLKVNKKNYNAKLIPMLQWYGQFAGANNPASLRTFHQTWLKEWAKANGFKPRSLSVPNQGISTVAALARIASKGFPISKNHVDHLKEVISGWAPVKENKIDYVANGKMISLKARIKNESELKAVLTVFDNAIDAVIAGDKKWTLKVDKLTPKQVKEIAPMYKSNLADLQAAYDKSDDELTEAIAYPRMILRRLITVHEEILETILSAAARNKVVKVARKKKVKPASALVSKLRYATVDIDSDTVSIDVEKIIGAQILYVFDTKKRMLKQYVSKSTAGISVSGTTLKDCEGVQKKIRKPKEQLAGFAKLTQAKAQKMFDGIRAVAKECPGRTSADSILLKGF